MKFLTYAASLLCIVNTTCFAANIISVVDSQSCKQMRGTDKQFILALKKGEEVTRSILKCVNDANLPGASFSGLGALENPTLDFYSVAMKKFQGKTFDGVFELISLNGTISSAESKRGMNIHVALGDSEYHVIGGHLDNALVGVKADITITPFKGKVAKKFDDKIGVSFLTAGA